MRPLPRISLRSLIFVVLAFSVATPVLLYGYARTLRVEADVLTRVDLSNKIATDRNADRIETLISARIEVIAALAGTLSTLQDWSPPRLQQLAKATVDSVDAFQYLTIVDASGTSIVFYPSARPGDLAGVSYSDREYVRQLRATNAPVVSDVIIGKKSGVAQIAIAAPVLSPTGILRGHAAATIPLEMLLKDIVATKNTDLQQRILVLDAAGQVLADTNESTLASLRSVADAPFLARLSTGAQQGNVQTSDDRGVAVRLAHRPIRFPGAPWTVWSMTPEATIQSTLNAERDSVLRSTGLAILFSFVFVLLVSRVFTNRLAGLERFAIKLGSGELAQRFDAAPFWIPGEIELLRQASNSTLEALETGTKQREQLLETIAEKNEAMAPLVAAWDHVGDAIEFTDPSGKVLFANPAAKDRRRSGPADQHVISRLFTELEDIKGMMEEIRSGASWRGSISYSYDGENPTHEDVTASPILDDDGGLDSIIIIRKDVSGVVRQKERANRNERLVALGTMAATVAHEINNPLTYVKANLDDVREQIEESAFPNSADLLECLDDALEGSDRVAMIVARMLRLVRREETEEAQCNVELVVKSAVDVTANAIRHRANLHVDVDGAGWVKMRDSSLFQVLVNLLNNAAQALSGTNTERHEVRVAAERNDESVVLKISDTGVGMTREQTQSAFDPFFTTKRVGEGTGLGLPLVKSMVEGAGGTIHIDSVHGRGTTFTVTLEATSAPQPRLTESGPSPSAASSGIHHEVAGNILIIDDEEAVARAIKRMLSSHRVEICTDSAEALQALQREHFDVVLSDVMMPHIDGYQLYQRAIARDPSLTERWIFMSGGIFGDSTPSSVQSTGCVVIEKPIDAQLLRTTIRRRISRSSSRIH